MILFKNANILINDQFIKADFLVENNKFKLISEEITDENYQIVDLTGKNIVPGFIDIHTHGGYGVDFNLITEKEDVIKACKYYNTQGVTTVLPTILTDTKETTLKCINLVVEAKKECNTVLGINLEGPFLSHDYKGAMPEYLLLDPNIDLFLEYQAQAEGLIKLTTISPELKGANEFVKKISKTGVVCSLGHSGADQDTVLEFIKNGASNATHLGNAMKQPTQHNLNVCGTVLYSDVFAEIICDGFHVNKTVIDYWFKVKGFDKMIAITDAMMAAGLPDGDYKLGVNDVEVINSDAKIKGTDIRAGSTLKALDAVKNIAKFVNIPFAQAVKFMTVNPAKSLGIFEEYGSIDVDKFANFVIMNENYDVLETYVYGKQVYKA